MSRQHAVVRAFTIASCIAGAMYAGSFSFTTGTPDGLIATGSRPSSPAGIEIESADDYSGQFHDSHERELLRADPVLGQSQRHKRSKGRDLWYSQRTRPIRRRAMSRPETTLLRISPLPNGTMPRVGGLTFIASVVNGSFTAANSVLNGINPKPSQF